MSSLADLPRKRHGKKIRKSRRAYDQYRGQFSGMAAEEQAKENEAILAFIIRLLEKGKADE